MRDLAEEIINEWCVDVEDAQSYKNLIESRFPDEETQKKVIMQYANRYEDCSTYEELAFRLFRDFVDVQDTDNLMMERLEKSTTEKDYQTILESEGWMVGYGVALLF